jgi:hypothetical protein
MPLERASLPFRLIEDERGIFVVVTGLDAEPTAYGLTAARKAGLIIGEETVVYRAHWSACPARDRFRK